SREHLLAISARRRLDAIVTDVLLSRGDREVMKTLVDNPGAQFSKAGLTIVASSAERDEMMAEGLGRRLDIPLAIFEQLLIRATETVRMRLLSVLTPKDNDQFRDVLAAAANDVRAEMSAPRDVAQTLLTLLQMQKNGSLDESAVLRFARANQYEELVVALGLLCSASLSVIDPLMRSPRHDGVLIPCRAANLGWPTVQIILKNRLAHPSISSVDLKQAKADYYKLS